VPGMAGMAGMAGVAGMPGMAGMACVDGVLGMLGVPFMAAGAWTGFSATSTAQRLLRICRAGLQDLGARPCKSHGRPPSNIAVPKVARKHSVCHAGPGPRILGPGPA